MASSSERTVFLKSVQPWPDSSLGYSMRLLSQDCRFDPWSKHVQEPMNECLDEWNSKPLCVCVCVCVSSLLFLSQINNKKLNYLNMLAKKIK